MVFFFIFGGLYCRCIPAGCWLEPEWAEDRLGGMKGKLIVGKKIIEMNYQGKEEPRTDF